MRLQQKVNAACLCGLLLAAVALVRAGDQPATPPPPGYADAKWNKSWLFIDRRALSATLVEGDPLEVTLEYSLDASEHFGGTKLILELLGPRVPKADDPKKSEHLYYGNQQVAIEPGRGKHVFKCKVPKASPRNWLLLLARFIDGQGKGWPWDVRACANYTRKGGFFDLDSDQPGNLFTYDEKVLLFARLKNVAQDAAEKTLKYTVFDFAGKTAAQGEVKFTPKENGQTVPLPLEVSGRGTFALEAEVEGWEKRDTTFARIPDLQAITGGERTAFAMTLHDAPRLAERANTAFAVARRLGLTSCRMFFEWDYYEPGPNEYRLEYWDPVFAAAAKHNMELHPVIWGAPPWSVKHGGKRSGYRMVDLADTKFLADMVKTVSTRYRGKLTGWEWLNEITPGGTDDCARDYAEFCRVGTQTAREIDPKLKFQLAGGLWPRNYRLEVLNAGAGKHVDALPIHYGNGSGVLEAKEDLAAYGLPHVAVWDNETGTSVGNWGQSAREAIADTVQPSWILNQWTDELAAGCERIVYFGGEGSVSGGYDYVMDDFSPRPLTSTLAVFASKMHNAKGLGVFSMGKSGLFHLFDRKGQAVLVASSDEKNGEEIALPVGADSLMLTDYQGNEQKSPAPNGAATLSLKPLRCFVEGADLDVLKAQLVPALQTSSAGGKREKLGTAPKLVLLRGKPNTIHVRLQNLYDRELKGSVSLDLPAAWLKQASVAFKLAPGQSAVVPIPVELPADAQAADEARTLTTRFDWNRLPEVRKPFSVAVLAPESIGNMLKNGGFEEIEEGKNLPKHWNGPAAAFSAEGLGLGLGKQVLKFEKCTNWAHCGQNLKLAGGLTYLYTAWVWNQGLGGGSNLGQEFTDGSHKDITCNGVFNMGESTPYWQLFTCRYKAPTNLVSASFVPVAKGPGLAYYDNLRVTIFEGTDFAAEATKVKAKPKIDGDLSDWDKSCPIPLIGSNQVNVARDGYKWTPANLNAVVYLNWDDANLYVALEVLDDVHHPAGVGEKVIDGDSVILAFDASNRSAEGANKACAYYLSAAKPEGGGSGAHTLFRPEKWSGGRPAGHLARDSSIYDLAVKPAAGRCVYELRIPFSELGMQPAFGGKLAFSLQLNDNDGQGLGARANWGGGISPAWTPQSFGVITFVE